MKKVTAFVGSARRKLTYDAVCRLLEGLRALGDIEGEIVFLSDFRVEACRGCKLCFEKGEEACPLKDDRDVLLEKMMASDLIVFASPNYMFQVSGTMKTFLDRLAFLGHRPRFFGKMSTAIVTQGISGGGRIVKYLGFIGAAWGFTPVKGACITGFEPMGANEERKAQRTIEALIARVRRRLAASPLRTPSWFWLMAFRMSRTSMHLNLDASNRDYQYYQEHGWFESDYYYPVRLGFAKRAVGALLDRLALWMARRRRG